MHPKTAKLRKKIGKALSLRKKVDLLENAYAGESLYIMTCGPSMGEFWNEAARAFLSDKLVMSVKQTHDLAPEICDFHILNSWNYSPYTYAEPRPIVVSERGPKDPDTPGMAADVLFRIPEPSNFGQRLATTWHYDAWLLSKTLDRPWGPGVMYELCFPLAVHMGVKEIVTMGWDLGDRNAATMEHFFHEAPEGSDESDGIFNKPRVRPYEVGDIARSTKALYYWLRSKDIYLYVISERSLVDPIVPRVSSLDGARRRCEYETDIVGNGGFGQWYGDGPKLWACQPSTDVVRPSHDTPEGTTAIELLPNGSGDPSRVTQQIQLEPFFGGARIEARMDARASDPGRCALVVAVFPRGKKTEPIVFKQDHPGDGQWHTIEVTGTIPADVNPHYIKVMAQLRAGAKQPATVTNVDTVLKK